MGSTPHLMRYASRTVSIGWLDLDAHGSALGCLRFGRKWGLVPIPCAAPDGSLGWNFALED